MKKHPISQVVPNSIADELGIVCGDFLLSVNGQEIEDVLDYYFLTENENLTLLLETKDGETWEAEIEKDTEEDLGLRFCDTFMGTYRHCSNHCIFCFIDQLPKGMRSSLYFKDDDERLSFLNGNYVTLTNLSDRDLDRIVHYHLSPINVSVQATDPDLRVKMLGNPRAAKLMEQLTKLIDAGITVNGQIVLCKGINDGAALDRSLADLSRFLPQMQSLSIVPVGLTRFRDGLYPLEPFTKADAQALIRQVEPYRQRFVREYGLHFAHLADEFYLLAEEEIPDADAYDGYLQIENGVGMLRSFEDEFMSALRDRPDARSVDRTISIATGKAAFPLMRKLADAVRDRLPHLTVRVYDIRNDFFGETITVSGLLCGADIIAQLRGKDLGETLYLPENLLRSGEEVLLDDVTVSDIEKALHVPVKIVKSSGYAWLDCLFQE